MSSAGKLEFAASLMGAMAGRQASAKKTTRPTTIRPPTPIAIRLSNVASDHGTAKRAGVGPAVHRPNPLGTSKLVPRKHEARIKWAFRTVPLPRTILPAIKRTGVVRGRRVKRPVVHNGRWLRSLALWEGVRANEREPRHALRINLIELIALPAIIVLAIEPAGGIGRLCSAPTAPNDSAAAHPHIDSRHFCRCLTGWDAVSEHPVFVAVPPCRPG